MPMAEVRRQCGQMALYVDTPPIPLQQCLDRKSVPKIVEARSLTVVRASDPNLARQSDESPTDY